MYKPMVFTTFAVTLALAAPSYAERGDSGHVNIFYWQAPASLNPYLSGANKDIDGATLVLEPLARFDEVGTLVPYLAASIPTVENGGVAEDLMSIEWELREGLTWSDGTPFTSDDVIFTANYCLDEEVACAQATRFEAVEAIEKVDDRTVRINFSKPVPYPYEAFVGSQSPVLQAAQFAECTGSAAQHCSEQNGSPIGTGPFKIDSFRANDVIELSANPEYRDPSKPAFATMTFKGGGDAAGAARAVLETREFDYAWNVQIAPEVMENMLALGHGELLVGFGTQVERLELNLSDPSPMLPNSERSSPQHPNPRLSDVRVRRALSMAIDRSILSEVGYGVMGKPTCNLVPAPEAIASSNTACLEQDIDGAKALLEEAGWVPGPNGIRSKDGVELRLLFQTTTNTVRQDFQSIIKQWWNEIGVDVDLRAVDATVFFGGNPSTPDTYQKFYADVQMYADHFEGTDPTTDLARMTCDRMPTEANNWHEDNIPRYCDPEYDVLVAGLGETADPDQRADIIKRLNLMLTDESMTTLPLVNRGRASARIDTLGGVVMNAWDGEFWNVADWYRIRE